MKYFPIAAMAALSLAQHSLAEPPSPDLLGGDARRQLQDSDRRFDELIRQQKLRQIESGPSAAPVEAPPPLSGEACLPVAGLRLAGITLLSRGEVAALGLPRGDCLDVAELNRFSRALTALYLSRGYIAARVLARGPDARGVLTLQVEEGRVAAIGADAAAPRPGNLFPGMTGAPLNVRDLDQGLDQANRLRSNHVTVDVLPGEATGESVLQLHNQPDSRFSGALSLDNAGRAGTGRTQAGASLNWDNAAGWSDFLSLSAQTTTDKPSLRHSRSESLFYSLPYGYWTFSAFASRADYLNPQRLPFGTIELSGDTAQGGVRLDRVLARDQGHILSAELQLTQKRVRNYFQDAQLAISSPSLTVLEGGLSQMLILPGGLLQLDGSLQRGTRWLGADAQDGRFPGLPNPQFLKLKLGVSWYGALRLPGGPYQLQSSLAGQASRDPLPGVEQLDIADGSAVRGFRNNSLAAETGWYWRNTLSKRLQYGGFSVTPRLGLDGGRALMRGGGETWQDIAGADVGVALARGGLTLDLDYSRPLRQPSGWVPEGHILFARLNWQW
ncbi:hemolysin activation protein [Chromobacterium sp. ATCC 53434]|uniref:ShlB/FhaC/HecB family hemolysin secretion/activation protein n=1 Tax=Chromobacterium sp. (strain ATCC 53434 / SC 14030) TaxID=2059672 RepID=UPI000C77966C|nr:ShlB/FhaC/HecB family hemolysin secretion/activation protein [Chromobacterium sp. ATCC 53434]AUH51633.1 hemolysin activation protein [Chromobacterium sp. ATCC 53434]